MNTKAIESLRSTLMEFNINTAGFASTIEWARTASQELLNILSGCDSCDTTKHYNCPIRRDKQWIWKDIHMVSSGCRCVECGEQIPTGSKCILVSCTHEGKEMNGIRCEYCHKISLDYCSSLGNLKETVMKKTGMNYITGEFIDEM